MKVRRFLFEMQARRVTLKTNLGSTMLRATSDDIECGMWNVECGVMYKHEK
jgi:hypothetical protein